MPQAAPGSPRIAYLIKCFPRLSETFILHEVLELERQGVPLRIFSLLRPNGKVNRAVQAVRAPVAYVPQGFVLGPLRWLAAALRRLLRDPATFLGVCAVALVRFHRPDALRHLLLAAYLAEELERERVTHLHAHYANTPATVALLAHQLTGIPFSFTAHAKDIYLSPRPALGYKMRQARFVVTCTGYNREYLASLLDPPGAAAIHRIYHGVDLRAFPPPASTAPAARVRPLILSVARLVEKKGLLYLLEACRHLRDRGYECDCRIVGEGPLRPALERAIRALGLADRVELWGAEAHERVLEMYRQATVMVLPAVVAENGDRDGIPNVLVEALCLGVPVVSTPVSGIPELIRSESSGLLVPERDSPALAGAIARLLQEPSLRERLTAAGRRTVLARFDMAANAERLRHLFLGREWAASPAGHGAKPARVPPSPGAANDYQTATCSCLSPNVEGLDWDRNAERKAG